MGNSFRYGTGIGGSTAPGQQVNPSNIHELPPGSVVRNGDGSRLIHLHDNLWIWLNGNAWCYDRIEYMIRRLDDDAVACHVAPKRKPSVDKRLPKPHNLPR